MNNESSISVSRFFGQTRKRGGGQSHLSACTIAVLSDERRLPHPVEALLRCALPYGPGRLSIIYRSFPGTAGRSEIALETRAYCRARGYCFLVAADIAFALRVRADGIHLPERDIARAGGLKKRYPSLCLTAAVHSARAIAAANLHPLDGVFLAPVFATHTVSARTGARKTPLASPDTVPRVAALVQRSRHPVWALGGVNAQNFGRLGACGFAGAGVIGAAIP